MKKLSFILISLFLISSIVLSGCGQSKSDTATTTTDTFKIGISQFVEHPALDLARKGFTDVLGEKGFEDGENIEILFQNAQADFPTTQTIANNFVSNNVDLILAIATPCAQSAANTTEDIPILFTAVTDPVSAGLVKDIKSPESNVTGTSDLNPIKKQFDFLNELLPEAENIGIVYNAAEPNSKVQVDIARQVAKNKNLNIIEATVANSSEVNQAVQTLVNKVDVIYTPTDNTVASAIGAVVKVANEANVPVFGAERAHVEGGALATLGIDYYSLGKQTGEIAVRVLNGEKPQNIPVENSNEFQIVINKKSAEILGIELTESIMSKVDDLIEK